jgi:hypothetical protein
MKQADTFVGDLTTSLSRGDVVLFIGAGLSIGAGLPGWGALVRPLAEAVGYRLPAEDQFITADHLLTGLQHYENQRGRQNLIQHLCDKLDTTTVDPTPVHQVIASLPVHILFTTNYDDLIEQALRQARHRHNVITSESQLALWSEEHAQVIKLCGSLDRADSIIITKSDFNTYSSTHARLTDRLRTVLEIKTALFLGYSLQDPFFNQIWDHIGLNFGDLRRRGYAALFDVDPLEADDLRRRGIYAVDLAAPGVDRTAALAEWLKVLGEQNEPAGSQNRQSSAQASPDSGSMLRDRAQPPTVDVDTSRKPTMVVPSTTAVNQVTLRRAMVKRFGPPENLDVVCQTVQQTLKNSGIDLEVNLGVAGGSTLEAQVLNLIRYLDRRGYLSYLLAALREEAPEINW